MKKSYLLMSIATLIFTACSSDDFVGNGGKDVLENPNTTISFSSNAPNLTRGDLYGSDAATKLGGKFVVYGTKHTSAEDATATNDAVVFNNYQVEWTTNTAGNTVTNTRNWEYVGKTSYSSTTTSQTVKYWDYNATAGYTFYAFSSPNISYPANNTNDKVSVTKVTEGAGTPASLYNKGYQITVKPGAQLDKLYFSDRKPVAKTEYDKTVSLVFRHMGTKVRVGFYETIPGYSVKIDKFYIDNDASAAVTTFPAMNNAYIIGFAAALPNIKTDVDQSLNVTYFDNTDATYENRPTITNPSAGNYWNLKLGTGVINTTLATSAGTPTWDQTSGAYNYVFPLESNSTPLLLKLDYTLTSEDGNNEVIKVRGARAIVPAQYVQWKNNFAYTYIFKISEATNGTTGAVDENGDPTDSEGLKPITFDAIVVDESTNIQETITTLSKKSVTTYANGAIVDEYTNGSPVYCVVMDESLTPTGVITPSAIGDADGNAQVYTVTGTNISEATVLGQLTGSPMGLTLTAINPAATIESTVPLADGKTASIKNVKFTPAASTTYAFVYTTAKYVAPTYQSEASGTYDSSKTYYMKTANNAYYVVSVPTAAAFDTHKAQLYTVSSVGTPGVYTVKIIKAV